MTRIEMIKTRLAKAKPGPYAWYPTRNYRSYSVQDVPGCIFLDKAYEDVAFLVAEVERLTALLDGKCGA